MIPQTVPTLHRDRHTNSTKQQPILLELTHDPKTSLGCSDTTCCACLGNNPIEEPQIRNEIRNPNWRTNSPVGRLGQSTYPVLRWTSRSTEPNRNPMSASRLTALVNRSPCYGRSSIDRAVPVHVVHACRPGGQPAPVLACCELRSYFLWTPISVLSLPMSFKNFTITFYLLSPYREVSDTNQISSGLYKRVGMNACTSN